MCQSVTGVSIAEANVKALMQFLKQISKSFKPTPMSGLKGINVHSKPQITNIKVRVQDTSNYNPTMPMPSYNMHKT